MAFFLVIEGLDGSGTTTQCAAVAGALRQQGRAVSTSYEPSSGPVGTLIRQVLTGRLVVPADDGGSPRPLGRQTMALLFAADRLDHLEAQVEPALARGEVAISDRYYHSSFAYQGDVEGELDPDYLWVEELNSRARSPDLTVYLEATAELCLSRLGDRGRPELYETEQKLTRLEHRYEEVMTRLERRGEEIFRVDASLPAEEITRQIVEQVVGEVGGE